jgi:hypothetical protein
MKKQVPRATFKDIFLSLAEISSFDRGGIVRDKFIDAGITERRFLAVVEQRYGSLGCFLTDQTGRMRFDDDNVALGSIPGPVNLVARDSLEVAFPALKAFVLNEEPNFSFLNEIDLLRLMNVGCRVITGRAGGDHQAAFVAVALARDHRALPFTTGSHGPLFWYVIALYV